MTISPLLQVRPDLLLEQSKPTPRRKRRPDTGGFLQLRLDLIQTLRLEPCTVKATCPTCYHSLDADEINKGFSDDPNDFKTQCPCCRTRFAATIVCLPDGIMKMELPFMCAGQVLYRMRDLGHLQPDEIAGKHQAVYRGAILHFRSLAAAFRQVGVNYGKIELRDREVKVKPFLGQMPDAMIAEIMNVSESYIRRLRIKYEIPTYKPAARRATA